MYAVSASFRCTGSVWNARANVGSAVESAFESMNSMKSALATAIEASRDAVLEGRGAFGAAAVVAAMAASLPTLAGMASLLELMARRLDQKPRATAQRPGRDGRRAWGGSTTPPPRAHTST